MDFVVLKVNGKDVSSASHEETIAAFTSAKEPILVEVLKRLPKQDDMAAQPISLLCNNGTQTEWTGGEWDPPFLPIPPSRFLDSSASASFLPNDPEVNHYSTIAGEAEAEEDDGCDVEYEEVVLMRSSQDIKLGLTLCYGAPDEPDTDIYISEIEPNSIAARDGRVQEGDQLLQINGVDVRSRDQAVRLFSERRPDFTMMLARPQLEQEEEEEEEEEEITTDTGTAENAHHEKDSGVGRTDESTRNDESSEQDAADTCSIPGDFPTRFFNCSDFPPRECGEDLILKQEFRRIRTQMTNKGVTLAPLCRFQSDASLDREMALLNKEMENIQLECETLVHRHMESQQKTTTEVSRCQLEHVYVNLTDLNAQKNIQQPDLNTSKKQTVERWVNSMFLPGKWPNQQQDRDSSSAYNTADSSGSGRLTLELTPTANRYDEMYGSVMSLVSPKMEDKGTQLRDSDVASMFSCDSCRRCCKALVERENMSAVLPSAPRCTAASSSAPIPSASKATPSKSYRYLPEQALDHHREERNKNYVTFFPGPNTMYTNEANLQHTIWLQQQMLRQAVAQQRGPKTLSSASGSSSSFINQGYAAHSRQVVASGSRMHPSIAAASSMPNGQQISSSSSKSGTLSTVREDEELKMEWKVKRRADGTRYITRRPVRNRLLKARAMKIFEERAGITTDDDTVSELKTGRYWSKEDRKRHLEKARDRKRKEMVIRSKMCSVKEQGEEGEDGKKEINILELSHKKMMKRRGKVVFDDFTTIQEVLAHGTKVANTDAKPLGLLTVTTV